MSNFTHLHVHTQASLLDGFPTFAEVVSRATELDQDSVAITDHGSMAGVLQFYNECKKLSVKPIIGIEAYFSKDISYKQKDEKIYHLTMLAKNEEGLKALYKISNISWNKGFYRKPRIDFEILSGLSDRAREGLVVLSGCQQSIISQHILSGNSAEATWWNNLFATNFNNYYIEIQPWNPPELNEELLIIADTAGIPSVLTADCHYTSPDFKTDEEINLVIQQVSSLKKSEKDRLSEEFNNSRKIRNIMDRINHLHPGRKLRYDSIDNYMLDRQALVDLLPENIAAREDLFENSTIISDSVDAEIRTKQNYFPKFSKRLNSDEYLKQLAKDGLDDLQLAGNAEYEERLNEELDVVIKLGFSDYFLLIWDLLHAARQRGIMVGPGRGSVGGSLLAYALGITKVDPIKYKLTFWRFLNISYATPDGEEYDPKFTPIMVDGDYKRRAGVDLYMGSFGDSVMGSGRSNQRSDTRNTGA